jgi:hypothetical protein
MKNRLPYEMTSKAIKGYSDSAIAKGETNDCVVRAFASSFEIPYDAAHEYVATYFNRKPRRGTFGTSLKLVKMANEEVVVNEKKVHLVGYRFTPSMFGTLSYDVKVKGEIKKRNMTVGTFIKKNPIGTFFVIVSGHAFTIKDGVVIGNYEDSVKVRRVMKCAFEIK